jgi:hypothetical protein
MTFACTTQEAVQAQGMAKITPISSHCYWLSYMTEFQPLGNLNHHFSYSMYPHHLDETSIKMFNFNACILHPVQLIVHTNKCTTYILLIFYIPSALLHVSMHLHHHSHHPSIQETPT